VVLKSYSLILLLILLGFVNLFILEWMYGFIANMICVVFLLTGVVYIQRSNAKLRRLERIINCARRN